MGSLIVFIDPDGQYNVMLHNLESFCKSNDYDYIYYNLENKDIIHKLMKDRRNKFLEGNNMFCIEDKPMFFIAKDIKQFTESGCCRLYRYKTKANVYIVACSKSIDDLDKEQKIEVDYMCYVAKNCSDEDCVFFKDYMGNPYYDLKQFIKK